MSYSSNHYAWQQRIQCEANAARRQIDQLLNQDQDEKSTRDQRLHEMYKNIFKVENRPQGSQTSLSNYSYHIPTGQGKQVAGTRPKQRSVYYQNLDFTDQEIDASTYVGKRTISVRPSTNQSIRMPDLQQGGTTYKTYIPERYFKRAGYSLTNQEQTPIKVDALGQRVRDRFNEQVSYTEENRPVRALKHSNILKKINDQEQKQSVYSNSKFSKTMKNRSASVEIDDLTHFTGNRTLIDSIKMKEYASVMRRVIDAPAVDSNQVEELIAEPAAEENSLPVEQVDHDAKIIQIEESPYTDVSQPQFQLQQESVQSIKSQGAMSMVTALEGQLKSEKQARERLETEIAQMRRVNEAIAARLGISIFKIRSNMKIKRDLA